ncbi:nucleoside hydrolase [Microbacterium sp. NPDC056057]|uniref:nucleoside hydrolase n=1 Tax=Microbacterium sp. NPDC056057 TaxID=3345699 RepID=UPI0035E2F8FC
MTDPTRTGDSGAPRARVILDNDFGGDPDGLFQLAHHLLSPSVHVALVVASKIPDSFAEFDPGVVERGVIAADRIVEMLGRPERALAGAETGLRAGITPPLTGAARAIIAEALRDDPLPLFYCAGGGLTDLATAYLHEPGIADRLTLVWIGGPGYGPAHAEDPRPAEFNTTIDPVAAGVVFASSMTIWQVPETTYEQCLITWAELHRHVAPLGPLAAHLVECLDTFTATMSEMLGFHRGETVVLGDSPLVLLTALRGPFRVDPSSSPSSLQPRRAIREDATYGDLLVGAPPVRVFTALDTRLMFGDLVAKLTEVGETA